ncbi:MAG: MmcQ/YjbR family DNA-binding protein, partial [Bdellovibrionota bacterium]
MQKVSPLKACEMARALEGVTEKDHFGSDAFIANGRIFATVWHNKNEVNMMIDRDQQKDFLARDGGDAFRPLENSWGDHAITVQLEFVEPAIFAEALKAAWRNSGNKRTPIKARKTAVKKKSPKKKSSPKKGKRSKNG